MAAEKKRVERRCADSGFWKARIIGRLLESGFVVVPKGVSSVEAGGLAML